MKDPWNVNTVVKQTIFPLNHDILLSLSLLSFCSLFPQASQQLPLLIDFTPLHVLIVRAFSPPRRKAVSHFPTALWSALGALKGGRGCGPQTTWQSVCVYTPTSKTTHPMRTVKWIRWDSFTFPINDFCPLRSLEWITRAASNSSTATSV